MPEIKNTFLKSKMNKDLDSRIVPNGEYRDAKNVSVSRSEGSDVGSLENVLGNSQLTDLRTKIIDQEKQKIEATYNGVTIRTNEINLSELEVIGYFSDVSRDLIFLFLTDYRDSSGDLTSNFAPADSADTSVIPNTFYYKGAACYIVQYNTLTNESTILVAGNFLNFSKTHPIYSVSILENLLFWTDNRNQPRKINIEKALNTPWENSGANNPYYYNEDHISVAKFAPYNAFTFLDSSNNSTLISNHEEFLPAHIITTAQAGAGSAGSQINIVGNYTTGNSDSDINTNDQLVILAQDQGTSANIEKDYTYNIQTVVGGVDPTQVTITGTFGINIDTGSRLSIRRKNPNYNNSYKGDTNLLREDFAKFSYRFKYDDDEYSIMAPFTQAAFVPKQFGYFIDDNEEVASESTDVKFMENRVDQVKLNVDLPFAGTDTSNTTIEEKLKIKEIQILVKNSDEQAVRVIEDIPVSVLNSLGNTTRYEYNYLSSKAIKTLPEADLIRVHDKIPIKALAQEISGNRLIYANYLNKHSSPDNLDYDLSYIQKPSIGTGVELTKELPTHTVKQNRSYQIGIVLVDRYGRASNVIFNDSGSSLLLNKNSTIYAPYNNYGSTWNNYFGNMLELNLRSKIPNTISTENYPGLYSETNPNGYYSYRIVIKQQEQDYYNVYVPGTLAGEALWDVKPQAKSGSALTESDVVGVIDSYLPNFIQTNRISMINLFSDNINKVPRELKTSSNANDETFGSETVLYNRVNPIYDGANSYNTQSTVSPTGEKVISIEPFRSLGDWTSTKGKFYPLGSDNSSTVPQPWYPYFLSQDGSNPYVYNFHDIFFNSQANPFIATIETDFKIGATPEYTSSPVNGGIAANMQAAKLKIERAWQDLGVYETKPTKSVLDIYYESSSSGLITDLNDTVIAAVPVGVIDANSNDTVKGQNIDYLHLESDNASAASPVDVTLEFRLVDANSGIIGINSSLEFNPVNGVVDGLNNDRTGTLTNNGTVSSEFKIIPGSVLSNSFIIQSTNKNVFLSNSNQSENYTFNLLATDIQNTTPLYVNAPIQISNCQMQNVAPIFTVQPSTPPVYLIVLSDTASQIPQTYGRAQVNINGTSINNPDVKVNNGSSDTSRDKEELVFKVLENGVESTMFTVQEIPHLPGVFDVYVIEQAIPIGTNTFTLSLEAIDANGSGLSTVSNTFDVKVDKAAS